MKIVAVVPIKLNNTRLSNKNVKCFTNGNPLITYILETLKTVDLINEIYVYCSSDSIKEYLPIGVEFLKRDAHLDLDTASINDILHSFSNDILADVYLLTHATAPFVSKGSLEIGVNAVVNEGYDSAFTVQKLQEFIWKGVQPLNYNLDSIPRTQDLPEYYAETSGFYVFKKEVLKKYNRRIGSKPFMIEISKMEGIDIDEEEDFLLADAWQYYKNNVLKKG